jgi:hypothetical protein
MNQEGGLSQFNHELMAAFKIWIKHYHNIEVKANCHLGLLKTFQHPKDHPNPFDVRIFT